MLVIPKLQQRDHAHLIKVSLLPSACGQPTPREIKWEGMRTVFGTTTLEGKRKEEEDRFWKANPEKVVSDA